MPSASRPTRPEPRALAVLLPPAAEEENTGWLVTFSDLVLQLFAFVLVAVVLGGAARTRLERASPPPSDVDPAAAIARRFEAPHSPDLPAPPPGPGDDAHVPDALDASPEDPPPPESAPTDPSTPTPAMAGVLERLQAVAAASGHDDAVTLSVRDSDLIVSLNDRITFPSGTADLLPDALPVLAAIRAAVTAMPDLTVSVEGHTDDVPIHTAGFPSNLELSLARAARVAHELTAGDAALAARTSASGFGEHRPVAPNDDPEGRARNRRVEIRLIPPEHPAG